MRLLARSRRAASTLASAVEVRGVGLHSGAASRVVLRPATIDDGVYFVRSDLAGKEVRIAARPESVVDTRLCTVIGAPEISRDVTVSTIEHLMAALCGSGVTACRIEVDAPELPLLDGSALPWIGAIETAGIAPADVSRPASSGSHDGQPVGFVQRALGMLRGVTTTRLPPPPLTTTKGTTPPMMTSVRLRRPVCVDEERAWVVAMPAEVPRITYGIDFPGHAPIGCQWFSWAPGSGPSFAEAIAPARTFGLREQLETLRAAGLIKGGSLDNALVCDHDVWLNGPLRFANEPVRHKLLDLVGDLSLLGGLPCAHVVAYRASHRLHVRLALALAAEGERQERTG